MNKPLKVLIIENSRKNMEFILRELRQAGYHPEYKQVCSASGIKSALNHNIWDLILSGYDMVRISYLSALKIVRERDLNVPFIIVSDVQGEDKAVDAIKVGVSDYIMKNNLSRLIPAVKAVLVCNADHESYKTNVLDDIKKYHALINNIADLSYICDTEGRIVFVNKIFEKFSGYKPEAFIGKSFAPLFDKVNLEKAMELYSKTLKGESPQQEICFKGTGILCEYKNKPLRNKKGNIIGVIGTARDITERKLLEDKLKDLNKTLEQRVAVRTLELKTTKERYNRLLENLKENHFFYARDTEGFFTYISRSITNILGYTPEEFLTHYTEYLTDNPINRKVIMHSDLSIRGIKQPLYEIEIYHKDGSIRTLTVQEVPVFDNNHKVIAVEGIAEDITQGKQTEELLCKLSRVVEQSPTAVIITDIHGNIEYVNPNFSQLTGYTSEDVIGENTRILKSGKTPPEKYKQLWDVITAGGDWYGEICNKKKNGELYWESAIISPIKNADGIITHFAAIKEDITNRKQAEEKLITYQTLLKRFATALTLTEERERRHISEEIHNRIGQYLTVIKIKLEEMQFTSDSERGQALNDAREFLNKVIQDTRSLTFEISPLILYELGFEPAVEWLIDQFRERYNVDIKWRVDGKSTKFEDDVSFFLFKSVRELLFNCIKHARAHWIKVSVVNESNGMQIIIQDDGVGFDISKVKLSVNEISGFGLFSIRERMEYFGGKLEVKSRQGVGTMIMLAIPLNQKKGDLCEKR